MLGASRFEMHVLLPLFHAAMVFSAPSVPSVASPPAWTIEWSAPPGCPTGEEVEELVMRWRRQAPPSIVPTPAHAVGRVEARGRGFVLSLVIDAEGTVTQHTEASEQCQVLAEATAVQIAMALGFLEDQSETTDPDATADTTIAVPPPPTVVVPPSTPTPVATPREPASPSMPPVDATAARARRFAAPRGALRVQAGAGTGRVPRVDARLGLGGALVWPRARLDGVVAHTFMQSQPHPDREGLSLRVWQWTGLLRGCWVPTVGPIELPLCAGLEAGASRATSRGVSRTRVATGPFVAGVITGALAWPFTRRFALWIELDGWVAATQPAFTVQDLAPWFTTRRGGVDGAVGFELRLP